MDSAKKFPSLIDVPSFEDGSFHLLQEEEKFHQKGFTGDQTTGKKIDILLLIGKCS